MNTKTWKTARTKWGTTTMDDLIEAIKKVIMSADPEKREQLTQIVKAYAISEDYDWAISGRAPALLRRLMMELTPPVDEDEIITATGMYDLLDAIKEMIASAEPEKREQLAKTFEAFADDNPEDYDWATNAQSPVLLHHLMMELSPPYVPKTTSVVAEFKSADDEAFPS